MCRAQWVLALVALQVGLAHSWDIAVSLGDQLVFYTDGTVTNTVNFISHNLTALAYDEVHNMMLYVDKQTDNDAVCGYNLVSMENKCFIKRNSSNIHSIAFDPATDTLFFTDTNERSINWISLKPGSNNNVHGNLLIKMNDRTPRYIAVDSCRGYIYWNNLMETFLIEDFMERAQFNGSERKVIINRLPLFNLAMDPQTRKIYYIDGLYKRTERFLKTTGLNGGSFNILYAHAPITSPQEMTVSKAYLYWINRNGNYTTVWSYPKNAGVLVKPKEFSKFYDKRPLGIVANYKIKDQIQGLQDCKALSSLIPTSTITNNSLNIEQTIQKQQTTETKCTTVVEPICVHGIKVSDTSVCKCTPGYIGGRCDVSVCENYCLQGDCSFNRFGLPKCRCNAGYSGDRCEVYACHGYCLNNGVCSLTKKDEPVCQCVGNHEGRRCEAAKNGTFAFTNTLPEYSANRNLSLADVLSKWQKPTAKISVFVEVI